MSESLFQYMQQEVQKACTVLKSGGIILYPTDTIWGLGCDATNKAAVDRLFQIKKRAAEKSLIVLIDHANKLNKYLKDVPTIAWDLIEFSDQPLTIIYPGAKGLADNVPAEDGSVGIRVVKDEFCRNLIHQFGKPIVSTSANVSGEASPRNFSEITQYILRGVDYVVNLRQNEKESGPPSAIIRLEMNGEVTVIRK